jgi:probable rRNA maturation factor
LPRRRAICRAAALAALAAAPAGWAANSVAAELSIVLGDDALLRRLNRQWRGKDKPTNVLSFPAHDAASRGAASPAGAPLPLGDVILAFGTVAGEAAAQGKTLAGHLAHLVVHGVLHLIGFDHVDDAAATRMEALETEVLAGIGVADPYRPSDSPLGVRHG